MDDEKREVPRQVRILKAMVIAFALALVAAACFLVLVGVARMGNAGFGTATLPIPAGCTIAATQSSGDRLVLTLQGIGEDCRRLIIADMKTGKLVGIFELKETP